MEENIETIIEYVTTYGLQILAAVIIFVVGRWIAGWIAKTLEGVMVKSKWDQALVSFLRNLAYMGLMTFVILAALSKLGIQTASFIAVLGAAGLAVGMALQGSLSNFAAGVMIIVFRPFKAGDFISAGGEKGVVQEITIFNTILNTPDNIRVIVPNAQITSGSISNYAANDTRRVDLIAGIGYDDDVAKAKSVLTSLVESHPSVLKDPAPTIAVVELADSSVNLVVRPWVKSADYWPTYFDLTEKIKSELEKNGLSIPFPQRDLHIKTSTTADAGVAQVAN